MPAPKADLSALISDVAGSTRQSSRRLPETVSESRQTPSRGRLLGSHVPEEVHRQFRVIAAGLSLTMENAHAQALNDFFAKHGQPEICPIKTPGRKKRSE